MGCTQERRRDDRRHDRRACRAGRGSLAHDSSRQSGLVERDARDAHQVRQQDAVHRGACGGGGVPLEGSGPQPSPGPCASAALAYPREHRNRRSAGQRGGCQMRRACWAIAITTVLILATSAQPAAGAAPTWVAITGPADWAPTPGYTLEIGRGAWVINATNGGGVTAVSLSRSTVVRVRRLSDCTPVVRFVAEPGRDYTIRFASNGSARVEDWTGQGMDSGPALGDPVNPVCPALPDTATASPAAPPDASADFAPLGIAAVTGLLAALLTHRRRHAPRPLP